MPPETAASDPVLLGEHRCQRHDCGKLFYLCRRCFRGQRYCSPACRQEVRRRQHRAASARYQGSPEGRSGHRDWQRAYRRRQRQRARSQISVTDLSFPFSDSGSSCGSDASRPVPQSPSQRPPRVRQPRSDRVPWPGLRCLLCGRPGYLHTPHPYEPDHSGKYP